MNALTVLLYARLKDIYACTLAHSCSLGIYFSTAVTGRFIKFVDPTQ